MSLILRLATCLQQTRMLFWLCKSLVVFVLFAGSLSVHAVDQYDATTNRVTIPRVVLGDTEYRDVVITVGNLVSVGGVAGQYTSKTSVSYDTYNTATGVLFIPAITVFGVTYLDVEITVADVISVGGSSPFYKFSLENPGEKQYFGSYNPQVIPEYTGPEERGLSVLATLDVNGDGYDDFVLAPMLLISQGKPVVLFYDPVTKTFAQNSQFQSVVPPMQHPRLVFGVDFNADGRKDLLFVNHGYDDAPWGEQNALILNTPSGFVNATNSLPAYRDYSHGAVVADFFLDESPDVLVLNSFNLNAQTKCEAYPSVTSLSCSGSYQPNSYVLSNNGSGVVNTTTLTAPLNFAPDGEDRLSKGDSADFNNDGIPDLVVTYAGMADTKIKIMESRSVGNYSTVAEFGASYYQKSSCSGNVILQDVYAIDLNGDGKKEILAYETCNWRYMYWRALERDASGAWLDATIKFFPDQGAESEREMWCLNLYFEDLTGDGNKDIVCSGYGDNSIWIHQDGKYVRKSYRQSGLLSESRFAEYFVMSLGDERYFVELTFEDMYSRVFNGWIIR